MESCEVLNCANKMIGDIEMDKRVSFLAVFPSWRTILTAHLCQEHFDKAFGLILDLMKGK